MRIDFWKKVTQALDASSPYRLTQEERAYISKEEQAAYECNLPKIDAIMQEYDKKLSDMSFWTERIVAIQGMRFRYNIDGYYGPGGFSSQFHIAGPLVLGRLTPRETQSRVSTIMIWTPMSRSGQISMSIYFDCL